MDVLTDLLHRARARTALVRQLIQRPPWSVAYEEAPALTVLTALGGPAWLRLGDGEPRRLDAGDIALVAAPAYTIADDPGTPTQITIRGNHKYLPGGEPVTEQWFLAPRTYGDGRPDATVVLRAAYELHGEVSDRLLALLPDLAVVPAGPRTNATLSLLAAEVSRDEPGQDAVLNRLLDLVLVQALRAWCAGSPTPPAWYRALGDPAIGAALGLLHAEPARRWTVAGLAAEVGLSRAAFAARFTALVGEPPLTYLTGWRLTLAADLLRDNEKSVRQIANAVGYADAFAFSVAFKRGRGISPSLWRAEVAG
ncbi:AraC family transcriptional regulator [Amycolatopsis rhabdoformis]|uniref:AraC family transcriptional regulator n=1 Tax=Amycolatopsis rhabdoformis TaxID=1448059 RepID=A0ABZ1I4P5_9PSEU|nr:AraC family transcriptional regulator [Amycolatopsis rhabdoformis]WSE29386.1 AraC family transcriptional regulator [Amycolatopsis rhabdoformis]